MSKAVLDGIVVIDWTHWHQGPAAAGMLSDLGAEVIHVEPPGTGDALRANVRAQGVEMVRSGRQFMFETFNRNKKSLALNLKHPEGRELLLRLVEKADVFLTNHQKSVVTKMGLDYGAVSARNPRVIYAAANAYGFEGPEADSRALEAAICAKSGIMMGSIEPGIPPVPPPNGVADRAGGVFLAYGLLAALLARERHGIGQQVTASVLGSLLTLQVPPLMAAIMTGTEMHVPSRASAPNPLYNHYPCANNRWIRFSCMPADPYWPSFCQVLGKPEWEQHPHFATSDARTEHCRELIGLLDQELSTRDAWELERRFREVDLPCSVIKTYREVIEDPQVLANRYIMDWDHPIFGTVKTVGFPVQLSETPATLRSCAPELGEHTEEVLLKYCECTWKDIERLHDEGII